MKYSYDRSKTSADLLSWGSSVFEWMEKLCNVTIQKMGHLCSGKVTGAKASNKYGVYATVDDAELAGDLTGTVYVSVDWMQGKVFFHAWLDHPQRGKVELVKVDLGYDDRPGDAVERAMKILASFCNP